MLWSSSTHGRALGPVEGGKAVRGGGHSARFPKGGNASAEPWQLADGGGRNEVPGRRKSMSKGVEKGIASLGKHVASDIIRTLHLRSGRRPSK